jgi:hypothetical protein
MQMFAEDRSTFPRPVPAGRCARALPAIAAAGLIAIVAGAAVGRPAQPDPTAGAPAMAVPPDLDPLDISGRDFSGLEIPAGLVEGPLAFEADEGHTWTEQGPGGTVHRLLLTGDVRVTLGVYQFQAARAVGWVQRLPDQGDGVYQVFVFFDRVGTPDADAAIAVAADRLKLQGRIAVDGAPRMALDVRRPGRPTDPLLREAEGELAAYLAELAFGPGALGPLEVRRPTQPGGGRTDATFGPGDQRPYEPGVAPAGAEEFDRVAAALPPAVRSEPIFAQQGLLSFSPTGGAASISVVPGPEETAVIIEDGVAVQYWDRASGRTLQITAERAVVFLEPGPLVETLAGLGPEDVRGVYLEGGVEATDGRYTLRGPRMFYDITRNRAVVVDAVFWTYDEQRRLPLYVRAKAIRQESADQFAATGARLTNTAFFEPHLAIGTSTVTLTRTQRSDGSTRNIVDARDITIRAVDVPFFYWPKYTGDPTRIPLRDLRFETSSTSGGAIKTTWDAFGLAGFEAPDWLEARVGIDAYFERGVGLGAQLGWNDTDMRGLLSGYTLPYDTGTDQLSSGEKVERDGEFRGMLTAEHRWAASDKWTVLAELSLISDENFIDAFFPELAETRREFTTRLFASRTDDNTVFTLDAKGALNNFTPNEYLLTSQGYMVNKLPEAGYYRIADDLLADTAPGMVSYHSEYRASRMNLSFVEPTASELGFSTTRKSQEALGLDPDESPADALRDAGYDDDDVYRFDTRQEISGTFRVGEVKLVPFAVGRFTAYDRSFDEFSPDAEDSYRIFGSVGTRMATTFSAVDDNAESRLLDIHRIRHIVEPSLTLWVSGASIDQADLPVYDDDVESLADGGAARIALDQTWQTQRGGPGRWRSVDVFTLDAELVFSTDDVDPETPIGRFIDYRPEFSVLGDYATIDATWQVTEAFSLGANTIYDFDTNQQARTLIGAGISHSPDFSTYVDLRYVNPMDSTYLTFGAAYRLTRKYDFYGSLTWDDDEKDIQRIAGTMTRLFPNALLGLSLSYNNITGETSFGVVVQPTGLGGGLNVRGLGATSDRAQRSSFGG